MEVEVEGCSLRLNGWRLRGCSLRLRGLTWRLRVYFGVKGWRWRLRGFSLRLRGIGGG